MSDSAEERKPPSHSQPEELVDHTIGEFRLLRRLGAGGMAEVYLAEQPSLGRVVAVKVLQPERVAGFDPSMVQRFEREARAAGGLNHPNIVQVYQTGEEGGIHFIVQEYIPGNNLSQQIRRAGPPELHQGLQWMLQIAEALHAADESGIVHRDIKPENIMLTRDLTAKVTDFGLAQLSQQDDQKNLTQTGTTMGTPLYMSPEQISGHRVDARSDQYSFGVTCYHMFAGRPPFSTGNSVTVAVQHLQDIPPPLTGHRADLPTEVCHIIHQMMSKKPEDRFQSTQELLDAIRPLQDLSVNTSLQPAAGFLGAIRQALPGPRAIAAGLLLTMAGGWLAGSAMMPPRDLAAPTRQKFDQRDTAAEQFAAAMLLKDDVAAWEAVPEYYPDTVEAGFAQLQLAMQALSLVPPDYARADQLLKDLISWTDQYPGENRQLRALALIGRALVASRADEQQTERLLLDQLNREELISEDEESELLDGAPRPLRDYWNRLPRPGRGGPPPGRRERDPR